MRKGRKDVKHIPQPQIQAVLLSTHTLPLEISKRVKVAEGGIFIPFTLKEGYKGRKKLKN